MDLTEDGMLVLTRQMHESIMIGDVEVVVLDIRMGVEGKKVRLGVAAPKEVPVHRKEIYEEIKLQGGEQA